MNAKEPTQSDYFRSTSTFPYFGPFATIIKILLSFKRLFLPQSPIFPFPWCLGVNVQNLRKLTGGGGKEIDYYKLVDSDNVQ
jgi:hypothetical protein